MPVYNAERFLGASIDSVQGQSCPVYKLILVDNGSTVRSSEIPEQFAAKDKRVKVLRQDNDRRHCVC